MYVRGTLCFMLQAKWTPRCPDQKEAKFPCRGFMHAHRSYHKMKGCLSPLKRPQKKPYIYNFFFQYLFIWLCQVFYLWHGNSQWQHVGSSSQGWNPGPLHCDLGVLATDHQGSPISSNLALLGHGLLFCAAAKSLQLCPTLCDPMDCSPPGSSVHGILQVSILETVAIPFSRGSSQPRT